MIDNDFIYLLGAGSSAGQYSTYISHDTNRGVLPIIGELSSRIDATLKYVSSRLDSLTFSDDSRHLFSSYLISKINPMVKEFYSNLKLMSSWCKGQNSIDVQAKIFYDNFNFENYNLLKATLAAYLLLEQALFGVDTRYNYFFSRLFKNKKYNFNSPCHIFSWNYDNQMEESLHEVFDVKSKSEYFQRIPDLFYYVPQSPIHKDFQIIKLNGSCNLRQSSKDDLFFNISYDVFSKVYQDRRNSSNLHSNNNLSSLFIEILDSWSDNMKYYSHKKHPFSFSWDDEYNVFNTIYKFENILTSKSILTVIGYSFPDYNLEADVKLLERMGDLEKIYLQVHPQYYSAISGRLQDILDSIGGTADIKIIPKSNDLSKFYFPAEFRN